jgi:hypothetical protein
MMLDPNGWKIDVNLIKAGSTSLLLRLTWHPIPHTQEKFDVLQD